jgi:hypothetical protein
MSALRELQVRFMKAVLDDDFNNAARLVRSPVSDPWLEPEHLLRIYANNARANFLESLRSSFPVTLRLVGEDYFAQCARQYQRLRPSQSGDLQPVGTYFADFLFALHSDNEYRYLGDIARLEWLCQESLQAGDHLPLDVAKLSTVAPSDYGNLRFVLHPSARLFESIYPCAKIWQSNSDLDREPEPIDLRAGHTRIAILRGSSGLQFHHFSPSDHQFLTSLSTHTLADAAAGVSDDNTEFDCAAVLKRLFEATIIVDFK